jgi:hypothetical protein
VLSLLVASAEPSKVPFYIAGLVLAGWAVALTAMGLTHPSFPENVRAQRTVIAISLVLVVAALATAIGTDP